MPATDSAQLTFDADRHARFAEVSCDYNPIHMDAIAARRTQAGAPIVHGIHSLLWLINGILACEPRLPPATSLKAQFRKPIFVGEAGKIEITRRSSNALRARILVEGTETVVACIGFGPKKDMRPPDLQFPQSIPLRFPAIPNALSLDDMHNYTGVLPLTRSAEQIESLFSAAAHYLGVQRLSSLICTSSLVGMIVPGLYSLFSALDLSFCDDATVTTDTLQFAVTSVEPRFRIVQIAIRGGGVQGSLEAVRRLPPAMQPNMARVAQHVTKDEFGESTTLIVGGSRGLGELTAKLIAAGGGRVIITYSTGKTDADAVARQIQSAGGWCETAPYDVRESAAAQCLNLSGITHLYYYATPPIFRRKAGLCDLRRLDDFNSFYVAGFLNLVQACLRARPQGLRVFYPSSVSIDTRPADMTEYTMSKAAAEILCADLQEYLPGLRIITRRLPRLATDQTNSVAPVESADAIEVILPIIREMHS